MPANKKYLTTSPLHRFLKISAGFIGGYVITQIIFMILMRYWDSSSTLLTLQFGGLITWCVLMILAFLSRNGFKIWGIYLGVSLVLISFLYLNS